jgi:competence protein ComEC
VLFKTFRQAPFLRIVLFYMAGIMVQYYGNLSSKSGYLLPVALILLLFSCFSKITKHYSQTALFGVGVLLLSFVCGVYMTEKSWKASEWNVQGFHTYLIRVMEEPVNKAKTRMYKVSILSADSSIREETAGKQAIIYLPKDSVSATIVSGDCLYIRAFLEEPQPLSGDASFDYPLYLRKQSCSAVAFVREHDWRPAESQVMSGSEWIRFRSYEFRRNLFSRLRVILPDSDSFSIAAALMFGYKNELDKDLRQSFSNIGAGHILAVSGLHFNLIFGIAYFLLSFIGMSKRGRIIKQLILLPVIWGFAFITGLSPSVIRAASMLSLWGIGNAFFYRAFSLNTLAVAAFFMLLHNPLYLFDIGFQLSFLAVLSILLINPLLINLYASENKIIQYLWELVAVSFSAQIGILPLSLYYFHQFPVLFLVTNTVLIPLAGILMGLIPFTLLLHGLFGDYEWMFVPLRLLMSAFVSVVESLDAVPGGSISRIHLSASFTFLLYAVLAFFVYLFMRKNVSHSNN